MNSLFNINILQTRFHSLFICKGFNSKMDPKLKALAVTLADFILACVIFGPFTIIYWRGTWIVLDLYMFPDNPVMSGWLSLCLGNGIIPVFYFLQNRLQDTFGKPRVKWYILVYHGYTYIFAFAVVNQWRGVWTLLDQYSGKVLHSAFISTSVGLAGLVMFRSLGYILSPPTVAVMDIRPDFFLCITRFAVKVSIKNQIIPLT